MSDTVSPAKVLEPPKSFAARFVGVLFSPGATFADIARKPDFTAPLIVLVLASVVTTEAMLWRIGTERMVRLQIEHGSRAASMTPQQIQRRAERDARIAGIAFHGAGLVAAPVSSLVWTGIGMLIVSVVFGSPVKFATAFSAACYASLVTVLRQLMDIGIVFFEDPDHFNPRAPAPTNLGFFLGARTPKPLMSLAAPFDVFSFWFMALLAIGFSEATHRRANRMSLFWCLFGLRMILALISMALSTPP